MSGTIDAIADRTSPSRIVGRQRRRMSDRVYRVREAVMGSAEDTYGSVQYRTQSMAGSVQERASSMADTAGQGVQMAADEIRQMPDTVKQRTQGSPFAAGLIAFGAGALAAAVFPSSRTERQAVSRLQAEAQPAIQQLKEAGQEVAEGVKESAQQAAQEVKGTASEAAHQVADEAKGAAQQVKAEAQGNAQQEGTQIRQGDAPTPSFPSSTGSPASGVPTPPRTPNR